MVPTYKAIYSLYLTMWSMFCEELFQGTMNLSLYKVYFVHLCSHICYILKGSTHVQHNLRLVIFVLNKYFAEFTINERFDDWCQAGFKGLITAIDRFEPKRGRLSTYSLFWIRHSIIRSMTKSSLIRYPLAFESVCIRQARPLCAFNFVFYLFSICFCTRKFIQTSDNDVVY